MFSYLSIILLALLSAVFAQTATPVQSMPPAVATDGFNDSDANISQSHQSWLQQHDRYVFVIVIAIFVFAILTWYVVRSIRSMRLRLSKENQGHMMMVQNGGGFSETVPVDHNGFHKMPDYASPPPQQQQHTHRY